MSDDTQPPQGNPGDPENSSEAQPTRSTAAQPREAREFDKTSMRANANGWRINRDYLAHNFRWGWIERWLRTHEVNRLLDVGCGPDQPLMRVLAGGHARPKEYLGVDFNRLTKAVNVKWGEVLGQFDFTTRWGELGTFDLITCFEVIEHMPVPAGRQLLAGLLGCLAPGGQLVLSTPIFNGHAARNHIHEYEGPELAQELADAGFEVVKRYGTFASYNDLKKVVTPEHLQVLDALNVWYDGNVTACFLAPLYPEASRNNVWVCKRAGEG